MLNENLTFGNFTVGPGNQLAHAASIAVIEMVGRRYNPLFIYGGHGSGKTHLINAVGNEIKNKNSKLRICCISGDEFFNDFMWSIRYDKKFDGNKIYEFRNRFRKETDVFLVDDVQLITDSDQVQEEFFNVFNSLYEKNKQIVLTSDKYPQEILNLEERLCYRFQWGLIADIRNS